MIIWIFPVSIARAVGMSGRILKIHLILYSRCRYDSTQFAAKKKINLIMFNVFRL
jgi:hypothetical protein